MGFKTGSFRCLLAVAFIQGMTVTCENVTEPTSNPGGELSVQPSLDITTAKETAEEKSTRIIAAEGTTETNIAEKRTTTAETQTTILSTKARAAPETTTTSATTKTEKETIATVATKEEKPTTTLIHEITASPSASYKTSSVNSYTVVVESFPAEESKPIMTSHPVTTSLKELVTSSKPVEIVDATSEHVEQVMTPKLETAQMSTATPILMSYPLVTSSPVMKSSKPKVQMSLSLEEVITPQVELTTSSSTTKLIVTSHPGVTSSPDKEIMTSSKSMERVMTPQVEVAPLSSTAKAIVTSHSDVKSSQVMDLLTSSKSMLTSSKDENEFLSSKTVEGSKFASVTKGMVHSLSTNVMKASQSPDIVSSSSTEAVASRKVQHSSQQIDMTSLQLTTSIKSSHLEDVSIVSTSAVFKSTPAVEHSSEIRKTSQFAQMLISSSVTPSLQIIQALTSSGTVNIVTSSYQTLKSSPVIPGFPSLKNTMSSEEIKATKSTLIFSSSQLADIITSTHPSVTSSSVVQSTEKEKTSKTPVATTTSITSPTAEIKVVHATSDAATEHPTHPEDKHTTHIHPHETHEHTNHTGQGEHVTRPTMGYPHEPDVDASNSKEQKHRDADWEVSVFVVIGLLGGMIVFVVFMVVKDKARRRGIALSKKKGPVGGDDKGFVLLKEIKTEEEPPKPTRVEKSKTPRNSYYGNPEDSIPLLELHIKDGEPPLLNAHDEALDTQPEETGKGARKVVDVYGDTSENSEEKFY